MSARTSTRRGRATREELLAAAARAFLRTGFTGSSLLDVAREAEVSKSAVLYHFGSKDQLLREVMTPVMDEISALAESTAVASGPLERRRLMDLLTDVYERHLPAVQAVAADTLLWRHPALEGRMQTNHGRLVQILAAGLDSPIAVERAHTALATVFRGMAFGLAESGSPVQVGSPEHQILIDLGTEILEGLQGG